MYKPVRKLTNATPTIAALCTFAASGLIHEWVLSVVFTIVEGQKNENGECPSCYVPNICGRHMLFFFWNAVLIGVEYGLRDTYVVRWVSSKLARPVISLLVVLMALPVGHLFTDYYRDGGLFSDGHVAFLMFVRVK